jgi:hypothetical protein
MARSTRESAERSGALFHFSHGGASPPSQPFAPCPGGHRTSGCSTTTSAASFSVRIHSSGVRYPSAALGVVLIVLAGCGSSVGQATPKTTHQLSICTNGQFLTSLKTNQSVYPLGEPITIVLTVHNTSGTCNNNTGTGDAHIVTHCYGAKCKQRFSDRLGVGLRLQQ